MSAELDNLVTTGLLEKLPASTTELQQQRERGRRELADAGNATNSAEGRFALAYSGIHALTMAALRAQGYRPLNKRQVAFLTLAHTVTLSAGSLAVISKAHQWRNLIDYEGRAPVDAKFLAELIAAGHELEQLLPNP